VVVGCGSTFLRHLDAHDRVTLTLTLRLGDVESFPPSSPYQA
jgi:hypothetical protein